MGAQQRQANCFAGCRIEQIPDEQHVSQGLGHLLPDDVDEADMHPVPAERGAVVGEVALFHGKRTADVVTVSEVNSAPP